MNRKMLFVAVGLAGLVGYAMTAKGDSAGAPVSMFEARLSSVAIEGGLDKTGRPTDARAELERHLALVAGGAFAPAAGDAAELTIVLGEKAPDAGEPALHTAYAKLVGKRLYLWGDEKYPYPGTAFAVYGFLEKNLGVVWPMPGDENIVAPPSDRVRMPVGWSWSYRPPLPCGMMRGGSDKKGLKDTNDYLAPNALRRSQAEIDKSNADVLRWKRRQKLFQRENPPFGHAFTAWNDKYRDEHPEWFALQADGERGTKSKGSPTSNGMKLCVSNEEVVDKIVEEYVRAGKPKYWNISPNDGLCFCLCEKCKALDCPRTEADRQVNTTAAHLTDRYVNFWNRIAKKIVAIRPDVMIDTYAYSCYRDPPRREKIACPDNMYLGMVPSQEDDNLAQIRAWKACGMKHFRLRPNYLCGGGWVPRGYERFFLENFRMNWREGMIGTDYDGEPSGEAKAFEYYAIARAHQDPEISFEQVEKEFLSQFGRAAPKMKEYYDRVRARNEKALYAKQRYNGGDKEAVLDDSLLVGTVNAANPPEELEKDEAILKEALATPGLTSAEFRRVKAMSVLPRHAILTRSFRLGYDGFDLKKIAPDFVERGMKLIDYRVNVMRPNIAPINWGPTFRGYPFEVRYWGPAGLKAELDKKYPEMGSLLTVEARLSSVAIEGGLDGKGRPTAARLELERHLALVAGGTFTPAQGKAELTIVLGEKAPGAGEPADFTACAKLVGSKLYLWGDDARCPATLFAVYGFLEKNLGVVWPMPGDDNIVAPRADRVRLAPGWSWSYRPPLRCGMMRGGNVRKGAKDAFAELVPQPLRRTPEQIHADGQDVARWKLRQKMFVRESMPFGHAFLNWNDTYRDTHPEYLALQKNGERGTDKKGSRDAHFMKLCVSNEGVVDQIVTNYVKAGKPKYYNICPNDGLEFCLCEKCRALDCPETQADRTMEGAGVHLTDRYVNFWNRIAKKIVAIRPDVMLDTYAYSTYRDPPRRERVEYPDNMCFGMVPSQEDDNLKQIRAWKEKGMKHFKLRPNYLCYTGWIPRGYERFFLENFRMNWREGMIGTDYDGSPRGEVTAFECYAIARAHQDPEITFEQVEREFLSQYGKAAPKMKEYFDRVRARNEKALFAKQRHRSGDKEAVLDDSLLVGTVLGANPPEELAKDEAILTEALATPGLTPAELRRVKAMSVLPRHAILSRDFQLSFDSEKTGTMAPDFVEKGLKLMDYRVKEVMPAITPVNWGPTFRKYPFEVKYWRQKPLKKLLIERYPDIGFAG